LMRMGTISPGSPGGGGGGDEKAEGANREGDFS